MRDYIELVDGTCAIVADKRIGLAHPWGFVAFRDSFMSGWPSMSGGIGAGCPETSWYALAVSDSVQAATVLANGADRSEMRDGRIIRDIHDVYALLETGDHVSIVDRDCAPRWYVPGAWTTDRSES